MLGLCGLLVRRVAAAVPAVEEPAESVPVETWWSGRVRRDRQPILRKDGQVLPLIDTRVSFPFGGLTADSEVLTVIEMPTTDSTVMNSSLTGFVTAASPFHPVDDGWPDQGPDRGTVTIAGVVVDVVDVVLGATSGNNLLTSPNIPVRRGEPGWAFVVVHVVAPGSPVPAVGQTVRLEVDPVHRDELNHGHTACHLAALALNAALADRWRKPVAVDGLGHPNFDQLALANSRIHPNAATDTYRIGKSLRKKGFDMVDWDVQDAVQRADEVLAGWVAAGVVIRIEAEGPGLTDRRSWVCELPEGEERIACGGTHPTSLDGVAAIRIGLTLTDAELVMETKVTRR
ncbi:metal-dependent hydrolase [Nakamurella sp. UYEF19]|uniref:metal-dependent hydrolase n=1 Tax=Nakamurella sp. UYEF19 TaxID=1756392 RepID=UPI0033977F46